MASSKKIGFFCGEEKLTLVELEKNTSVQVVSALTGSKTDPNSPFSSNLTEEIHLAALIGKILQDYRIQGCDFYVSLPMKDIILRSFIIPSVSLNELQNVIKFEARKYVPLNVQDLSFVFYTTPFVENQIRRIKVIFFAVRKEVLARYERVFQQLKVNVFLCDPCPVSLVKALLYKKEIKPTDHVAFLYLDKNSGYICFIDQGIPQFVREFTINIPEPLEQANDGSESLNVKVLNEVANSFDFYTRQFNTDRVERMIVSSSLDRKDLFDALGAELKVKIKTFSPLVTTVGTDQINHMEAIYALGAGVDVPMHALSAFNFLRDKTSKLKINDIVESIVDEYKDVLLIFLVCVALLAGMYVFLQTQLKNAQKKCDELAVRQGVFLNQPVESLQAQIQENTNKLSDYKGIKIKSEVSSILLRVASLLPEGTWLKSMTVQYEGSDLKNTHVTMGLTGDVFKDNPNEQIAVVNSLVLGFRNDKTLSGLMSSVNLVSLKRENIDGRDVTLFTIHCS